VLVNLPPTTVYADSTTERKLIATPWFAGSGLTAVRCSFELSEAMSPIEVGVGIQSANVPTGNPTTATIFARQSVNQVHFATGGPM
jgi:hypothetical protein